MITRIVSALVGIAVGVVILIFADTLVLNLAVAVISVVAVYELIRAKQLISFVPSVIICIIYVAVSPFLMIGGLTQYRYVFITICIFALFTTYIFQHSTLTFDNLAFMIATSTLVSLSICCIITIHRMSTLHGTFFVVFTLAAAWLSDAGAYFVGTFFGKHKLCPSISPKKTVEGAIGGVIVTGAVLVLGTWVYSLIQARMGNIIKPDYIMILITGSCCAVLAMLGDLTASLLKRQCSIKDYGSIMPGHGGMMDRFDSVLFVAPFVTIILYYFPMLIG